MLRKLADGVQTVRTLLWFAFFGWVAVLPPFRAGVVRQLARAALFVIHFVLAWGAVWFVLWQTAPTLLVGTRAGLQTMFQVVPATEVAVLVLIVGAAFAAAQIVTTVFGPRATIMLGLDPVLQAVTLRPLVLLVASLLLAGQVPDEGPTCDAVTAGICTIVLATVRTAISAAYLWPVLNRFVAPRNFAQMIVSDVEDEIAHGALGLVVMRVPMLGEMLRAGITRSDATTIIPALEAMEDLYASYLTALEKNPAAHSFALDDGTTRDRWMADDLAASLVRGGEQALALGLSGEETRGVAARLGSLAVMATNAGELRDAERFTDALVELGTTHQQVTQGGVNFFAEPAWSLTQVEASAEAQGADELAAQALAGWLLLMAYAAIHFSGAGPHPLWEVSAEQLGPHPPWEEARELTRTADWRHKWANKLHGAEFDKTRDATIKETRQGLGR